METPKAKKGIYPAYFYKYISLVENEDLNTILKAQGSDAHQFLCSINEKKWDYKYAEDKWTIKEVMQHVIDTERVFNYRALVFSRKDGNIFPGFDQDNYAVNSNAVNRKYSDLMDDFAAVRKSTESLFSSFSPEQLDSVGSASDYQMSVKALGYTIAGHLLHHINILKEKYLFQ